MDPRTILVAAASFLALAACAPRPGAIRDAGVTPDQPPVRVNVTNEYGLPVEVAAAGCNTVQRLGIVYPGLVSRYVIPQAMLACSRRIELIAYPEGGGQVVRPGEDILSPGDVVDFRIRMHLAASYTSVRSGL